MNELAYMRKSAEGSADFLNEMATTHFCRKMYNKLRTAERKGRHGWFSAAAISEFELLDMLKKQSQKPFEELDYIDIANFAMMLHFRTADRSSDHANLPNTGG